MRLGDKDVMQGILAFVQAVALVIGGCWIALRYLTHEREAERLSRQQVSLNNEQLIRLATTQKSTEEARLRQLQLGNQQTELTLAAQGEQQRLNLDSQKVTLEQARLSMAVTKAQQESRRTELDAQVELAQLDVERRKQDVSYAGEIRFKPEHTISAKKLRDLDNGLSEFELTYSFTITSQATQPFDVSFYVADLYVGIPRDSRLLYETRRLNIPNLRNPTMRPSKDDAVDWKHVNAVGAILAESTLPYGAVSRPSWSFSPPVELSANAIGLGHLEHGEWCGREEIYFVVAPENAYVTAFLAYCFNSCTKETDGFTAFNTIALRDARRPSDAPENAPTVARQ